ncbi:alpha/beta fold hydrolase [Aquimarina algicola]|uniref:Alpha/beta hydrolase n=1 Tax=Aquimarina algicola TaxID=2589995 RepID=A0A504JHV3_9FLAO|nr:alpha/beta hydrolase [Aquimarina algicola]TPN86050.1 alpha/beta hydrolase [Aquimarina algicola]
MIKKIKKFLKKFFQIIGILLVLIILAGLGFRLLGPESHNPEGKLIDVDGTRLHINVSGIKNNKPTIIIEGGASASTEYYHWLNEGLKDSLRVIRYDRAGNGYSDLSDKSRNAETIAKELHQLLEKAGEKPPYILAGHSMGGPYIRVFTKLYPDEVQALVFIDATHPEQVERLNAASKSSFRFKTTLFLLNTAAFFSDLGVIGLFESFSEPLLAGHGLPNEINERTRDFVLNGKRTRAYKREIESYHSSLKSASTANDFGSLPIKVFTAIEIDKEAYRKSGIDPDNFLNEKILTQKEFIQLSTDGEQFLINGNHQTIFTKKENADFINKEILKLVRK